MVTVELPLFFTMPLTRPFPLDDETLLGSDEVDDGGLKKPRMSLDPGGASNFGFLDSAMGQKSSVTEG